MEKYNAELIAKLYKGDNIIFKITRDNKEMEITVPIDKNKPIGY
jgi:hypothetical protein